MHNKCISLIVVFIMFCSCGLNRYVIKGKEEQNSWWKDRKETVGTVTSVASIPTALSFKYSVGDTQFIGHDGFMDGRRVNLYDQFIVAYNPEKPEQHVFMEKKDVITYNSYTYRFSKATIQSVDTFYNKDSTEIEYVLYYRYNREFKNGKVRFWPGSAHFYNFSLAFDINDFVGRSYRVVYDKRNYSVVVLLLNEPVSSEGFVDPLGKDRGSKNNSEVFFESISL